MTTRKPPPLPRPAISTKILRHGTDGLYVKGHTNGFQLVGTAIVVDGNGRSGVIYDIGTKHDNDVTSNCYVRIKPRINKTKWGFRRYEMSGYTEETVVDNPGMEHGFYDSHRGTYTYRNCAARYCGAQGFQARLSGNRGDPDWSNTKTLSYIGCTTLECGQERGGGRAGFSISIKDQGPNTDVVIDDCYIRTIFQTATKVYNGKTYDSFGALCVEYCKSLTLTNTYIEMKNPDRDVVQLFDYANKAVTKTGPARIDIDGLEIERGGNLVLREEGASVRIANCIGTGFIKIMRRDAGGTWRLNRTVPLAQGLVL